MDGEHRILFSAYNYTYWLIELKMYTDVYIALDGVLARQKKTQQ